MKGIDSFKSLKKLHLSLLAGQCLFAIISLSLAGTDSYRIEGESFSRSLQIATVIFSTTALFIGFNLFKKAIFRIRSESQPGIKRMEQYRKACIIWWIMVEGPGLFSLVFYLWTDNLSFFFLACFHILILFVFMPKKENIIVLLKLNSEETTLLEGRA